jgi:hypothetical protein
MPREVSPKRFTVSTDRHWQISQPTRLAFPSRTRTVETMARAAPAVYVRFRNDGRIAKAWCSCEQFHNVGTCLDVWERSRQFVLRLPPPQTPLGPTEPGTAGRDAAG